MVSLTRKSTLNVRKDLNIPQPTTIDWSSLTSVNDYVSLLIRILSTLTFTRNFECIEKKSVTILAGQELKISHDLGAVPSKRIITRQTGSALITDGVTPWTASEIYLKYNAYSLEITFKVLSAVMYSGALYHTPNGNIYMALNSSTGFITADSNFDLKMVGLYSNNGNPDNFPTTLTKITGTGQSSVTVTSWEKSSDVTLDILIFA